MYVYFHPYMYLYIQWNASVYLQGLYDSVDIFYWKYSIIRIFHNLELYLSIYKYGLF